MPKNFFDAIVLKFELEIDFFITSGISLASTDVYYDVFLFFQFFSYSPFDVSTTHLSYILQMTLLFRKIPSINNFI